MFWYKADGVSIADMPTAEIVALIEDPPAATFDSFSAGAAPAAVLEQLKIELGIRTREGRL